MRILLLSDLSHAGQNALLNSINTNELRADILVAGTPGESEPASDALLNAVQPRVIVIADSELPANKRAGSRLRERLAQRDIPVFYASDSGAVTVRVENKKWELHAVNGRSFSSLHP